MNVLKGILGVILNYLCNYNIVGKHHWLIYRLNIASAYRIYGKTW